MADERDTEADERERVADEREIVADERERRLNDREAEASDRELLLRELGADADERDRDSGERERRLIKREADVDERERLEQQREVSQEMARSTHQLKLDQASSQGTSLARTSAHRAEESTRLRNQAANLAEVMADEAEQLATYLEGHSAGADREHRLEMANTEREIARIERENAARLRDPNQKYESAGHLPPLRNRKSPSHKPSTDPGGGSAE